MNRRRTRQLRHGSSGVQARPQGSRAIYGRRLVAALLIGFATGCAGISLAEPAADGDGAIRPLRQAHAHNDYYHDRPLLDALDHGFCNVEADIFLVDGKLLVGHGRSELKPERTLEKLYLQPLQHRVRTHGGRVHRGGPEFLLLVDIKSDGPATFRVLHETLARYKQMLTCEVQGQERRGAVRVVVSGNRPQALIAEQTPRYAGIDGRISDLESDRSPTLMPLISDNWRTHFRWRGEGDFSEAERGKLRKWVRSAHDAGRKVRFWATPESPDLWGQLRDAGVDLINTDDLAGLQAFLSDR